jgi:zinc transport system ATP-binding protein
MQQDSLLSVNNLTVHAGTNDIIHNISFTLSPGEVLAVIGPNGAGKSVLLKTLLGIMKPNSGTMEWKKDIRIGYLPQRFLVDLYLPMTVEEFLDLKPHKTISNKDALKLVSIEESWLPRRLSFLSSGQMQRVLLAWALLDDPQVLLFDEPTENVDVAGQESIYTLLHHLQESMKIAVLIVSHDLHAVYKYADSVLCLNQKMMCFGAPDDMMTHERLTELFGEHTHFEHTH